jgi:hypothetical protein
MDGICTLANDLVYDQLVALLNSIEVNVGQEIPVCVYPYDSQTDKIAAEIARRPNVQLYNEPKSIERWENFSKAAWQSHPTAFQRWPQSDNQSIYRLGMNRRYCAFDGPFDRFLYMDADTLLLGAIDLFWDKLNQYDCVVYDYQYKDPTHIYQLSSPKLTDIFTPERIQTEIFCAGIYAAKKGLFDAQRREWLISKLNQGEAEILYPMAPNQSLLNYMIMRAKIPFYNIALHTPKEQRVGNCVTDLKFVEQDHLLYDKGYRLIYLHYIGLSSRLFRRVCGGENIDFPYRNIFLHYRYLQEPEKRPQFKGEPIWYHQPPSLAQRVRRKLKRMIGNHFGLNSFGHRQ